MFLLSNRQRKGDNRVPLLPTDGLMVEVIDATHMHDQLVQNTVNVNPFSTWRQSFGS